MRKAFSLRLAVVLAAFGLIAAACSSDGDGEAVVTTTTVVVQQQLDIVDTAVEAGSFGTLVSAVQAAGLVETLKGEGPFTVFAPTDAAFAALPAGTIEALLGNPEALQQVLLSHVVSGSVDSSQVVGLNSTTTAAGGDVAISVDGANVIVGGATVVTPDIRTSNGIIHVIDQVIVPQSALDLLAQGSDMGGEMELGTIAEVAAENGSFTTLLAAVEAAGLVDTLNSEGPFTVFAPTDEAFAALPEGTVAGLLEDIPALTDILLYHVVAGAVPASDVVNLTSATTVGGSDVTITVDNGNVFVDGAQVIITDVPASNGIIHVIDQVILP